MVLFLMIFFQDLFFYHRGDWIKPYRADVCNYSEVILDTNIRVGKTGSLGPWSRVIVYYSKLSFAKMILSLEDHFGKRTACYNTL